MAEGHVCGSILPRKFLKFETRKCHFLHSEHPNLPCLKIYANYTCIVTILEIKEGKKRTNNKIIINNNLSLFSGGKT